MFEKGIENIAFKHAERGEYLKALELHEKALNERTNRFGQQTAQNHPDVATNHINIGNVLFALGRHQEARCSYLEAMKIREKIFENKDQQKIAQVYSDIGLTFQKLCKYQFSMQSFGHAIQILEMVYPNNANHPNICVAKCSFADVNRELCKYNEAVEHLTFAYNGFVELCRTDSHPILCDAVAGMAKIYVDISYYNEAIKSYTTALAMAERKDPGNQFPVHPDVPKLIADIANVYLLQGNYEKACEYANAAVTKCDEAFGDTRKIYNKVQAYNTLGNVKRSMGCYSLALDAYNLSLEILLDTFGANGQHPDIADTYDAIALVYQEQAQYQTAHQFHNKAADRRKEIYDDGDLNGIHIEVANGLDAKASTYFYQDMFSEALALYCESLSIREAVYGENSHHSIAKSHCNIAKVHTKLSRFEDAGQNFTKALNLLTEKIFCKAKMHSSIAEVLSEFAELHNITGEYGTAIEFYKRAQSIYDHNEVGMENHPNYAKVFAGLGTAYEQQGKLLKALEHYNTSFQKYRQIFNDSHRAIGVSQVKVALAKLRLEKFDEALNDCFAALDYFRKAGGIHSVDHPDFAFGFRSVALICIEQENYVQAEEYLAKSLAMYKAIYGPNCLERANCYDNLGRIHMETNRLASAEEYINKAAEMRTSLAPARCGHIELAESYFMRGVLNFERKDYLKAISEFKVSLEMIQTLTGNSKHPKIAKTYSNIGNAHIQMEALEDGLEFYKLSLKAREDAYGDNAASNDIAIQLYNIGSTLIRLRRFKLAYPQLKLAIEMLLKHKTPNPNNPYLASAYYNMALIGHCIEGSNQSAVLKYYFKAEELFRQISPTHHQLANVYENIGLIKFKQCEYKEALEFHQKSLEIRKTNCRDVNTGDVAKCYDNIATTTSRLGKYKAALKHFQKSFEIKKRVYGCEAINIDIANSYHYIGTALERLGNNEEALKHNIDALTMYRAVHTDCKNHPDIARALYTLGMSLCNKGEYDLAIQQMTDSLKTLISFYGADLKGSTLSGWPDINLCFIYTAIVNYKQKAFDQALDFLNDALSVLEVNEVKHPNTGLICFMQGKVHVAKCLLPEAKELFYQAIEEWKEFYEDHPDIANCYREIGAICETETKYNEAIENFCTSFEIKKRFGEDSRNTLIYCDDMASVYRKLHDLPRSLDYLFKALRIRKELYGPGDHEEIANNLEDIADMHNIQNNTNQTKHFTSRAKKMRANLAKAKAQSKTLNPKPSQECSLM